MTTKQPTARRRKRPSAKRDQAAIVAMAAPLSIDPDAWLTGDDVTPASGIDPDTFRGDTFHRALADLEPFRKVASHEWACPDNFAGRIVHGVWADDQDNYLGVVWQCSMRTQTMAVLGAFVWSEGMAEPLTTTASGVLRSWIRDDHDDPASEVQRCLAGTADEDPDTVEMVVEAPTWTDEHLARGRRLVVDLDGSQWSLGDLAVEVFGLAPDQGAHDPQRAELVAFAEDIGMPVDRLAEYRMVASRWEADDRLEGIGWTLHRDTRNREHRTTDLAAFIARCRDEQVAPTRARLRAFLAELDGPAEPATPDVVRVLERLERELEGLHTAMQAAPWTPELEDRVNRLRGALNMLSAANTVKPGRAEAMEAEAAEYRSQIARRAAATRAKRKAEREAESVGQAQ